jgi:hypothetical protein
VGLAFCVYVYGAVAGGEPSEVTEASQRSIFCASVVSGMLADRKSASRIQLQEIGPIRLEQCGRNRSRDNRSRPERAALGRHH